MKVSITEMRPEDYDAVYSLWQQSEGVGLSPADAREPIRGYLARNPGFSLVAHFSGRIVGAVLCGHDGRRGYLYHLAVATEHRKHGLGKRLVEECLSRLALAGIQKTTIYVYAANQTGQEFWRRTGWKDRADLVILQKETATRG